MGTIITRYSDASQLEYFTAFPPAMRVRPHREGSPCFRGALTARPALRIPDKWEDAYPFAFRRILR